MDNVIYEAIVGSRLYGTATSASDLDTKGIFGRDYYDVVPTENHYFGLKHLKKDEVINKNNGLEGSAKVESVFYSLKKFIELCMKGNPTLIEVAFVPNELIIQRTDISDEIMTYIRNNFMTKKTLKSYIGYFLDQKRGNASTPKKASHVYRIGVQAVNFAKTGIINPVLSGKELEIALNIRNNNIDKDELDRLIAYVDLKLQQAEANNNLISEPDEEAASNFLVYIHKKYYKDYHDPATLMESGVL
jgi:predicted nucleotidyltransferase